MVSVDSVFATYDVDCHNLKDYASNKMQYVCYTILCITPCITNGDFKAFCVTQRTSVTHGRKRKTSDNLLIITRFLWAENGTRTRDLNLGKVALSSPQNATRLGVTNWAISFYDDFLECVLPRFSHWLNGWLNICVCLLVCKWLLIRELFNGLNKFCNTFFLVIHWHSEFMVFK